MIRQLDRIPKVFWVLLVGGLLLLPSLGSFGLWEPVEIRHADVARDLLQKGHFADVTVGGQYTPRPVLSVWLTAIGFKLLGVNELAARLPLALWSLLGLLLAFRVGSRLVDDTAGLAAAFVLATTPTYLFQSRQLGGEIGLYTCLLAAVGGLAAYLWPRDAQRRRMDLLIGAAGLVCGFLARGLLLGTLLPLLIVGVAVAASWEPTTDAPPDDGEGPQPFGGTLVRTLPTLGWTLAACAAAIGLALLTIERPVGLGASAQPGKMFQGLPLLLLGGIPRLGGIPPTFEQPLKSLGFGMFPWFALLPVAIGTFLWGRRDSAAREHGPGSVVHSVASGPLARRGEHRSAAYGLIREHRSTAATQAAGRAAAVNHASGAFLQQISIAALTLGYLTNVLWALLFGTQLLFVTLPLLAVGVGVWARQHALAARSRPFWGIAAAGFVLAIHQDFFMGPGSLAFSHLTDSATYPVEVNVKHAVRFFGLVFAALFFVTLSTGPGAPDDQHEPNAAPSGRLRRFFARLWAWARAGVQHVRPLALALSWTQRRLWVLSAALGLVFAAWCVYWLTPTLSYHMSNKALFETYHACRGEDQRSTLAQYRSTGGSAAYYTDDQIEDIQGQAELFKRLRKSQRFFALVPASQLAPLDQAARKEKVPYYVLDDRSSKFLIISNQLAGQCSEDRNPLRRFVTREAPAPRKRLKANFEDRVELIGYDVPDVVRSGGKFPIKLYFHVKSRVPSNYKLFLHFDKPASRFHGDHKPLDGKYATQYWLPGDYITDVHEIDIPLLTTTPGVYTIYMGFWLGSKRLKVTKGPNDGANRVILGRIRVRAGL